MAVKKKVAAKKKVQDPEVMEPDKEDNAEPTFQMKQGEAKMSVEYKKGMATEDVEKVGKPVLYDQPTCNVGVKAGVTRNMGDYNSVRIDVSLFMPCYPEEIEGVYEYTKEWVEKKMNDITEELDAE